MRGAPGASGCAAGSNASLRFCGAAAAAGGRVAGRCAGAAVAGVAPDWAAPRTLQLLEAVLDVLLELRELVLELAVLELQLLDLAGELPDLVLRAGSPGPAARPHPARGTARRRDQHEDAVRRQSEIDGIMATVFRDQDALRPAV